MSEKAMHVARPLSSGVACLLPIRKGRCQLALTAFPLQLHTIENFVRMRELPVAVTGQLERHSWESENSKSEKDGK
jgi:hypothetical protein